MCAEQYKAIHPIKFYRDYINHNIRPDGRKFHNSRPLRINVKSIVSADGSAIVKAGQTTVVCGIKAELTQPTVAESDKGFLVSNIDLTPLCSPKFRSGQQNDEAQMLTSTFDDLVKNSQWLDLKQLCIAKEKLVWVLYCDITCLDYDGSILDASVVAFDAAMKTLTLPEVKFDSETGNYNVDETTRNPLIFEEFCPVSTTFSLFDEKILLVDPDSSEEELGMGLLTIATYNGELCLVCKPGGIHISDEKMNECVKIALKREHSISELISTVVQK